MDRSAIRRYAIWARHKMLASVRAQAERYDLDIQAQASASFLDSVTLNAAQSRQRTSSILEVQRHGLEKVLNEVAYTWFSRFCALRFMEVNDILPSHIRIFTNGENQFKPQILQEATNLDWPSLNKQRIRALKEADNNEELFKYLIIAQCNALSVLLPGVFKPISDTAELLFPDFLLEKGSLIDRLVSDIVLDDWKNQVQIVGWLYQYYMSERHGEVIQAVGKVPIAKEDIPAATQLFTPDWIVRYMVENSLGSLWLQGHPLSQLRSNWPYYITPTQQDAETEKKLQAIRKKYAELKPQDLRCIDPCAGSGHVCVYFFDTLMQIYTEQGVPAQEAVCNILSNNLWGLDIDERAAQLTYFSVMMKAVQYDPHFLLRSSIPQPHIYAVKESDGLPLELLAQGHEELRSHIEQLRQELHNAQEYGSIVEVTPIDFEFLLERCHQLQACANQQRKDLQDIHAFLQSARALASHYHVVVTNPPYLSRMDKKLKAYVRTHYPDYANDLFSVFMVRNLRMCYPDGLAGFMTPNVWMFIRSHKKLRRYITEHKAITSLIQLTKGSFKEASVNIAAFVLQNSQLSRMRGIYLRLEEFPTDMEAQRKALLQAASDKSLPYVYTTCLDSFASLEGYPIIYWCPKILYKHFAHAKKMFDLAQPRQGLATADNDHFLRLWFEINIEKAAFGIASCAEAAQSSQKWFPYNKGGGYRKWYGNKSYLVNWENDGEAIKNFRDSQGHIRSAVRNANFYFRPSITWSDISQNFSGRLCESGSIFDVQGSSAFPPENLRNYLLGFLNSSTAQFILSMFNPTMHTQVGDVSRLPIVIDPVLKPEIDTLVQACVERARLDWDDRETSWNFTKPPLLQEHSNLVSTDCQRLNLRLEQRFQEQLRAEARLNELFATIYNLEKVLSPQIPEKEITVRLPNPRRYIKELISYAVGCMLGRYSLDEPGLIYAGGHWDHTLYQTFPATPWGLLPIGEEAYFSDDIVTLFIKFIETVYGPGTLEENLHFIANILKGTGTGSARQILRHYFLNDFFKDHCNLYQASGSGKRPIYWLFDSGKYHGCKCLLYLHRYTPDTMAHLHTNYLLPLQTRNRALRQELQQRQRKANECEKSALDKELVRLTKQAEELRIFEEKVHRWADLRPHLDLDDGVKHNYALFQDVLAKIK